MESENNNISRLDRRTYFFITMIIFFAFYKVVLPSDSPFWCLVTLMALFYATVQRLHDTNKSGHLAMFLFVPFFNILLYLLLLFAPGTPGPNKYGPPFPDEAAKKTPITSNPPQAQNTPSKYERLIEVLKSNHPYKDMRSIK